MEWTKIREMEFVFRFPSLKVQAELETLFGVDTMQDQNAVAVVTKKLHDPETIDKMIPIICEKFPSGSISELLTWREIQAVTTDFFGWMGATTPSDCSDGIKHLRDSISQKMASASPDASQSIS